MPSVVAPHCAPSPWADVVAARSALGRTLNSTRLARGRSSSSASRVSLTFARSHARSTCGLRAAVSPMVRSTLWSTTSSRTPTYRPAGGVTDRVRARARVTGCMRFIAPRRGSDRVCVTAVAAGSATLNLDRCGMASV